LADYPSDYEFDIVLRDGAVARFRPLRPADAQLLLALFEHTGAQSRYYRFFRAKDELTPEELEHFTTVDYVDRMAFGAFEDGEMVGVGRYDREADEPEAAEVAFLVADAQQGRGIGTALLQMLGSYGRAHGVRAFKAFVLPENLQMMRVFRSSGYELSRTLEEGVYSLDFPTAVSAGTRAAEEEREKRAVAASILPILYPRSIAVIGASRARGSIGARLFSNLVGSGFTGAVYPVNPKAGVVHSVRAYPSILDIPDPVDLAFIVVPAAFALDAVRECAEKRVKGLVVITAGFSEVPGGEDLERQILEVARSAGMRMVGPNCMGVLNTDPAVQMNGTFAPVYPPRGNVAMSSQSGALGIAILDYARQNNIGISTFISVGNKADVSGNDLLLAWEEDPATDVIVLYLESFGNPRRFARLARRIARKKPIVAVKSGRTNAGTRAASSHTGALASVDVAVEALFNQAGVIRTTTLEELFGVASLLANQPVPGGRRVGVITNAGGPGILAADALESEELELPELSEGLRAKLAEALSPEASTRNPIDLIASASPEQYRHCIETLIESDEVDAVMVIYIPTTPDGLPGVAAAVRETATAHHGKKTFVTVFMESEHSAALFEDARIPTYVFPEAAAIALSRAARYGEWLSRPEGTVPILAGIDPAAAHRVVAAAVERLGADGGWLEPGEVDEVLAAFGIRLPASRVVVTADAAADAAAEIGGKVVLKVIAPSALHKSDVGGVLLDVEGEGAVRAGFEHLMRVVDDPDGVLVQEMVPGGHEVLIGVTEDPSFGPLLVFGLGGVYVELLKDVAVRIAPITDRDAAEMMGEIKTARLLQGRYRSFPAGDLDALQEALLRVSALVEAVPELVEMDMNPVKVLLPGEGVRVVDARIKVRPHAAGWSPELLDIPGLAGHR
jgi:acetyl coenzyme A synthetase (ADP forming)-like protein